MSARPEAPRAVRAHLRGWLTEMRWPGRAIDDIALAVSEAVTNVVEHAYRSVTVGGIVEVDCEAIGADRRQLRIWVRDRGRWRPRRLDPGFRGWGLEVIAALMLELRIQPREGGGTEVMMLTRPIPPI
ncbi:ATP-binding protein [Pseudonocardia asaccharolytica]|uniref:ATP-binding protein n=1 Tax=Pseudonocardia asaccharolytica TaxID=54010 RepID=UPI001378B423|nr:ATP-binding protein [Pseudonocardia asaccharolytica]